MKFSKKSLLVALVLSGLVFYAFFYTSGKRRWTSAPHKPQTSWKMQSIDTMKLSRDLAREKMDDENFDVKIESEVKKIANLGATHISIGTPYDEEFIPFMKRWIKAARENGLNVWFRGNFSGWENWFEYPDISKQEHIVATREFILNNSDLFEDGDIFTACTECENGQIQDPRMTGRLSEYRQFLFDLYQTKQKSFQKIEKDVVSNYFSMNGDVAELVMDKDFTEKIGGIIVIDHYVADPKKLDQDIRNLGNKTGAKIVLGEFGAPIPDIHGNLSEEQQSSWVREAMELLYQNPHVEGINYWVLTSGSSALLNQDGSARAAAGVISDYFRPKLAKVKVVNSLGVELPGAALEFEGRRFLADSQGTLYFGYVDPESSASLSLDNYQTINTVVGDLTNTNPVIMNPESSNIYYYIKNIGKKLLPI